MGNDPACGTRAVCDGNDDDDELSHKIEKNIFTLEWHLVVVDGMQMLTYDTNEMNVYF